MENTQNAEKLKEIEDKKLENKILTTIVLIAACLAISSLFGGSAGDDVIIFKNKANDQWAFFQSKSIKQNLYETNKEVLSLELERESNTEVYKAKVKETLSRFDKKIDKYEKEKDGIKSEAEKFDKISDDSNKQADVFDRAEIFYQIAIAIGAIALLIKSPKFWMATTLLGLIGIGISVYAYSLGM
jgi:hypothetical protein